MWKSEYSQTHDNWNLLDAILFKFSAYFASLALIQNFLELWRNDWRQHILSTSSLIGSLTVVTLFCNFISF